MTMYENPAMTTPMNDSESNISRGRSRMWLTPIPVSYTHLTLPTSDLV